MDLIFAHMFLQCVVHMQKVLQINYDMILACLIDWILNPLNTLILKLHIKRKILHAKRI